MLTTSRSVKVFIAWLFADHHHIARFVQHPHEVMREHALTPDDWKVLRPLHARLGAGNTRASDIRSLIIWP